MTGLIDVRDRTLTMLRALGIEPDPKQMRTVEKYVRWVDGQISTAHIDGRAMDREIAGGHEMVVTHDCDVAIYTPVCHEPRGANCQLICAEGCTYYSGIAHDGDGAFHSVSGGWRHRMIDSGECQAVLWLGQDPRITPAMAADGTDPFEIGRFSIRPVWTGCGVEWQRVRRGMAAAPSRARRRDRSPGRGMEDLTPTQ